MPDEVKEATDGYRQEMDTFSSFIEECCIVEEAGKSPIEASGTLTKHGAGERRLSSWSKAVQCKNDGARLCCQTQRSQWQQGLAWHWSC